MQNSITPNKAWLGLRGLVRGNGHWGGFPEKLLQTDPRLEFELLEIPGNGTRFQETTPLQVSKVIQAIQEKSELLKKYQSVNLLGLSLGGMISMKWAELYPHQINKLIVVNSSLSQFSPFYRRLIPNAYRAIIKIIPTHEHHLREKYIFDLISNNTKESMRYLTEASFFSKSHPVKLSNFFRQLYLAQQIQIYPEKIKAKPIILFSRNDHLVHYSCSLVIAKTFSWKHFEHPTAGHDLAIDDSPWLIEKLIDSSL
jgi:pimeloyl-ACP methyl ester carboxylesterase